MLPAGRQHQTEPGQGNTPILLDRGGSLACASARAGRRKRKSAKLSEMI